MEEFQRDLAENVKAIGAARRALLEQITRLSDDDLRTTRRGGWSVQEVLRHLIDAEVSYAKVLGFLRSRPVELPNVTDDDVASSSSSGGRSGPRAGGVTRSRGGRGRNSVLRCPQPGCDAVQRHECAGECRRSRSRARGADREDARRRNDEPLARDAVARVAPGVDAAIEVEQRRSTRSLQQRDRCCGAFAVAAVRHDRAIVRHLSRSRDELSERHVGSAGDVSAVELTGLPHVEYGSAIEQGALHFRGAQQRRVRDRQSGCLPCRDATVKHADEPLVAHEQRLVDQPFHRHVAGDEEQSAVRRDEPTEPHGEDIAKRDADRTRYVRRSRTRPSGAHR